MSDRIKKIKIKQADGTFSDYIPIGANAKDIDLQYNGSNVENTLKKKPYYYDSVAAMKLDDTLKEGDMAITLGYYEANDGGGAEYIKTEDDFDVIFKPNFEYSSLIFGDITSESSDDTSFITELINLSSENNIIIKLLNKNYYTSGNHKILSNTRINLNGAILNLKDNSNNCFFRNLDNYSTQTTTVENIEIYNGKIDCNQENNLNGNLAGMFLIMYSGNNIKCHDLTFYNAARNTFNMFETSNSEFYNLNWYDLNLYDNDYVHGGNYCLMFENRSEMTKKGSNIKIENILVDGYKSGVMHLYNYSHIDINNFKCINPVDSESLSYMMHIPITFTNTSHCTINNMYAENSDKQGLEINAGSKFLTFTNTELINNKVGIIFGNNGQSGLINSNIEFINCTISGVTDLTDSSLMTRSFTYNYTQDVTFESCTIIRAFSGDYEKSNLRLNNCNVIYDEDIEAERFNLTSIEIIMNSNFNNNIIIDYIDNKQGSISVSYNLNGANDERSKDIIIPFLTTNIFGYLSINSYYIIDPKQYWRSLYPLSIWNNNDTVGELGEALLDTGSSSYRKVTPSLVTKKKINITTPSNNDVNTFGTIKIDW